MWTPTSITKEELERHLLELHARVHEQIRIVSDRSNNDACVRAASDELDALAKRVLDVTAAYTRSDQLPRAHPMVLEMAAAARGRVPATSRGAAPPPRRPNSGSSQPEPTTKRARGGGQAASGT